MQRLRGCHVGSRRAQHKLRSLTPPRRYSLRVKRQVTWDGADGFKHNGFMTILCVALLAGLLEKTEEKPDEGRPERRSSTAMDRRSTASRSTSRSSSASLEAASPATAKGRKSLDVRKSIWDGGAGGADAGMAQGRLGSRRKERRQPELHHEAKDWFRGGLVVVRA